ncbi:MAG: ribonuclease P protein component [Campylobacterota bacterium]|nr:ribonuclease P protein component [Campylobacterota bacterium]
MKQHKEFQYVYRKGKSQHSNSVVLFFLPHSTIKKIGFTATKKIGNAVKRNRSKRRFRALFLKYSSTLKTGTYIFVAKQTTPDYPSDKLELEFKKVINRAKAFENAKNIT